MFKELLRHTRHSLEPLFAPSSVAVVGASNTPDKVGHQVMKNLVGGPFSGVVYPVNPNRKAVLGIRCFPSLSALPEPAELALICTATHRVCDIFEECVAAKVPAAIIMTAGFGELGEQGKVLESRLRELVRSSSTRLVGPNCLGVMNPLSGLNATFAAGNALPGRLALVSQSGALCTAILDWSLKSRVGFSRLVSLGSMLDVDFADMMDYLGEDPHTKSILLYIESVGDARRFMSAARQVARTKPIIVVKAGRSPAGARAAVSHTGALTGSDEVCDAAFRRAGLLRVNEISDLFGMAEVLASQPLPAGNKLLAISNAGGPAVLASDAIALQGGQLAPLSEATWQQLRQLLPPYWSGGNPIDLLGDASPQTYRKALEICNADPSPDGFLIILTPQGMSDPTRTAESVVALKDSFRRPLLASWMGAATVQGGMELLHRAGIPTFETPERATRAFLYMHEYAQNLKLQYETPAAVSEDVQDPQAAQEVFQRLREQSRRLATEVESKRLFQAHGIPVVETRSAVTENEAVEMAAAAGYPVVLKIHSTTLTHKGSVGGVRLHLMVESAVRAAFRELQTLVERLSPPLPFEGVSVQPMVAGRGLEAILGCSVDEQFGPVILFGSGGALVEVFRDRAIGLPPMNRTVARRLIESTKLYRALAKPGSDYENCLEPLEEIIVRFSGLVLRYPEIHEIDINPLWIGPDRILALDGRVLLYPAGKERPPLAISPYPRQYESEWTLKDGTPVLIRPIRPEDEPLMAELFQTFSPRTIQMRFFGMIRQMTHDQMIRFCNIDYDREIALVATARDTDHPRILGSARLVAESDWQTAEFAVVVGDPWQRLGLGKHFLELTMEYARQRGLSEIHGDVLTANEPMLALCRQMQFSIHYGDVSGVMRVSGQL
ncbi:MAG: bifunctional acetate--CoA ligase family protein/GNAT family N-acetyltransferase [Acidobacteria bacterium]|nr:bifunctional acetate--CoA ligase family protein/GNAT family N-acetyltransferase [Acidobacteriota bacterium]